MDFVVTLKEGKEAMHGPEVSNNLPAGILVKYCVQLQTAIKKAVVDATKSKTVKNGLLTATWKWDSGGPITDAMKMDTINEEAVGKHVLKFKIGSTALAKSVRCQVVGVAAKVADPAVAANAQAVKQATSELASLKGSYSDFVSIKVGDSNHPKNVVYTLTMGEDTVTASIPHPLDTHVKEGSLIRALADWKKNKASFIEYHKSQRS
jgi:hypothetical protein